VYVVVYPERLLDAWLTEPQEPAEYELKMFEELPRLRTMLDECVQAATSDNNAEVVRLVSLVRSLFRTAEIAVRERWKKINYSTPTAGDVRNGGPLHFEQDRGETRQMEGNNE
jgi:hypothetical protein